MAEEGRITKECDTVLLDIVVKKFKDLIDTSRDMISKRVITWLQLQVADLQIHTVMLHSTWSQRSSPRMASELPSSPISASVKFDYGVGVSQQTYFLARGRKCIGIKYIIYVCNEQVFQCHGPRDSRQRRELLHRKPVLQSSLLRLLDHARQENSESVAHVKIPEIWKRPARQVDLHILQLVESSIAYCLAFVQRSSNTGCSRDYSG